MMSKRVEAATRAMDISKQIVKRSINFEDEKLLRKLLKNGLKNDKQWMSYYKELCSSRGLPTDHDPKKLEKDVVANFIEKNMPNSINQDWAKKIIYKEKGKKDKKEKKKDKKRKASDSSSSEDKGAAAGNSQQIVAVTPSPDPTEASPPAMSPPSGTPPAAVEGPPLGTGLSGMGMPGMGPPGMPSMHWGMGMPAGPLGYGMSPYGDFGPFGMPFGMTGPGMPSFEVPQERLKKKAKADKEGKEKKEKKSKSGR